MEFNPPPGWPPPPEGWIPPTGWTPDPTWPQPPEGWQLWIPEVGGEMPESLNYAEPADSIRTGPACLADEESLEEQVKNLTAENRRLKSLLQVPVGTPLAELDDRRVLQDVGIYQYHHPLESAAAYKEHLETIEGRIASLVSSDLAIVKADDFILNNSLAQGRRLATDLSRLMLRAYNAEVENSIRTLRAGTVQTALRRVERARDAIAKLGSLMDMHISDEYHSARVQEVELTSDWLMKKQDERDAAREERARLREEEKVRRELEEERARLNKERDHILNTLSALETQGRSDPALEDRLTMVVKAIEDNDFRAANIRAGYVYVISNQGAFGEGVVKIGLTRRLKPLERIAELSGASVPFKFDVHTLFFSEDAVTLEAELHRHFATRALNLANARKEFFFATPAEVRLVLLEKLGTLLEFTEVAEAAEFRQSLTGWPASRRTRPS